MKIDIQKLIGQRLTSKEAKDLLLSLGENHLSPYSKGEHVFTESKTSVNVDKDGIIDWISVSNPEKATNRAYIMELIGNINFNWGREELYEQLGKPEKSGEGFGNGWDKFKLDNCLLHIGYLNKSREIDCLTFQKNEETKTEEDEPKDQIKVPELLTYLSGKLPRCLVEVDAKRLDVKDSLYGVSSTFALKKGIEHKAKLKGYPLSRYNKSFTGDDLVSPISLIWEDGTESLIFDSQVHGYHGEMNVSAKIRGEENPVIFTTKECESELLNIEIEFIYSGACKDLLEDEPDLNIVDYFTHIIIRGSCDGSEESYAIVNMDL